MEQRTLTVPISGMHCKSCEILLEKKISKVEGVLKVSVNHATGLAKVLYSKTPPSHEELAEAVREAGYAVAETRHGRTFFSKDPADYFELLIAASILIMLWLFLAGSGLMDRSVDFGSTPALSLVFVIGLVAGVSTCMALVGGLVLGITAQHAKLHPEATIMQKFRPNLFFNLGRLVSYTVLGGVIGTVGGAINLSGSGMGLFVAAAGVVMFILGIRLIGIMPGISKAALLLPKSLSMRLIRAEDDRKEYSHRGAILTGAATFFLPCGFTQAMQIYAVSTGSFTEGALIMGLFALGTTPGLLGIGGLTSFVKGQFARYFFKFTGLAVIVFGLFNLQTGLTLAGIPAPAIFSFGSSEAGDDTGRTGTSQSRKGNNDTAVAEQQNGVQIVRMDQLGGGYRPNQFTIKNNVPVRWIITSKTQYSCAAFIAMPTYGIRQGLKEGENVIEFTPTKIGTIRFTCSMGMYSGTFTVIP